jgi:hypothetical protein
MEKTIKRKNKKMKKTIKRKTGDFIKTNKYVVRSVVFENNSFSLFHYRNDIIDLINNGLYNGLFIGLSNELQIQNTYQCFWDIEGRKSNELVKVIEVFPFCEFKKKYPNEYKTYEICIKFNQNK